MKQGAATPDQAQFQTDAERQTRSEMAAAVARGEDPLGDDEPLVRTDAEAAEANEPAKPDETVKPEKDADESVSDEATSDEVDEDVAGTETKEEDSPKDEPTKEEPVADEPLGDNPVYATGNVKALQDARAEIEVREDAIEVKWIAGELTDEERIKQLRPIRKELDANLAQTIRAETLLEVNEQNARLTQKQSIDRIKAIGKSDGTIDYDSDEKARGQFDRSVRVVMTDPDFAGKSFHEVALEAHRMVGALRGVSVKSAAKPALPPERKPPAPPPTLRGLPAAASAATGGGFVEQMARLRGQDYEAAFRKLTPGQKAALLDE